jgi:hypothetical protein
VFPVERVTWLHGCVRRTYFAAIDAHATIIIVAK